MTTLNHRTKQLKIVGEQPEVEKLWNDRFRLVYFCEKGSRDDTDYASIDRILPSFGSLQSAALTADGQRGVELTGRPVYPNMRLVEAENVFIPATSNHNVKLTYETITDTFAQEKDDDTDYALNGLQRVSRSLIAASGTAYTGVVGTTTIDVDGTTLYLASFKIDDNDAFSRVEEIWMEAGILREAIRNMSEGVQESSTTFLHIEGTVIGPVVSRSIDNFEGLQTITVSTMQGADGESLVDGGERVANSYEQLVNFSYPGIVDIEYLFLEGALAGADYDSYQWVVKSPTQRMIESTTYVIFQDSNQIAASDYTYGGATGGFWNPSEWAWGRSYGIGFGYSPFAQSKGFRGCRAAAAYDYNFTEGPDITGPNYLINGARIRAQNKGGISLTGGPEDPVGNTYTLSVKLSPAFDDVDGVTYYKKVIVVSEVPVQVNDAPVAP
jgi:hypothetical protein